MHKLKKNWAKNCEMNLDGEIWNLFKVADRLRVNELPEYDKLIERMKQVSSI